MLRWEHAKYYVRLPTRGALYLTQTLTLRKMKLEHNEQYRHGLSKGITLSRIIGVVLIRYH